MSSALVTPKRIAFSPLLWLGLLGLVACQTFLFLHVLAVLPRGDFEFTGRVVRANMTPLAWCFYLMILLGLLTRLDGRSYLKRFRNRLAICWLWAIPAWCYFDWMNKSAISQHACPRRLSHVEFA